MNTGASESWECHNTAKVRLRGMARPFSNPSMDSDEWLTFSKNSTHNKEVLYFPHLDHPMIMPSETLLLWWLCTEVLIILFLIQNALGIQASEASPSKYISLSFPTLC